MRYNYYYYSTPISKAAFVANVPSDWESGVNELGTYTFGGYRAESID